MSSPTEESILDKLDKVAPAALNQFDAFPKLPTTYKTRSGERGVLSIIVAIISFLLIVNDIGEYFLGWPTYSFGIDTNEQSFMDVNVDLIVNMPCRYLSVDLRDAMGDRLFLSDGFRRDGTLFDAAQARSLQAHTRQLDARHAVAQSRKSRGFFDVIFRRSGDKFRPTYNYKPDGSACRVYGSIKTKKVTANLHITTAGHGYRSREHVDHSQMNLSHVITDFSFGPYFPDMTQPLQNTYELAKEPFVAYQYFLAVVPTTYIAPGAIPLHTNQYSVTHYTRVLDHDSGVPGIFFKFDIEPLHMTVHQKTTTFVQFLIRVVGVVGGVWCCAGWAFRISSKAYDVVSGADKTPGIVAAESSGAQTKRKWGGGELRSRASARHSWMAEGGSPYSSYAGTPVGGTFSAMNSPAFATTPAPSVHSPSYFASPYGRPANGSTPTTGHGLGLSSGPQSFATQQQQQIAGPPKSPNLVANGLPTPNLGPTSPYSPYSPLGPASPSVFGPASPAMPSPGPPRRVSNTEKKTD